MLRHNYATVPDRTLRRCTTFKQPRMAGGAPPIVEATIRKRRCYGAPGVGTVLESTDHFACTASVRQASEISYLSLGASSPRAHFAIRRASRDLYRYGSLAMVKLLLDGRSRTMGLMMQVKPIQYRTKRRAKIVATFYSASVSASDD